MDIQTTEKDGVQSLKDTGKQPFAQEQEVNVAGAVVNLVKTAFDRAKMARRVHEDRMIMAYRNFRGLYGPDVTFTDTEKSRVFVKITKTKTLAALGQILDVLYASGKFPVSVEPTEDPLGAADLVTVSSKVQEKPDPEESEFTSPYGFAGDGKEWKPGQTVYDLVGPDLGKKLDKAKLSAREGAATDPQNEVEIEPAKMAAKKMERAILDQLEESSASIHLRHAAFEMALLGTGIIKGPFTQKKTYHRWAPDTENPSGGLTYQPINKNVPKINSVSCWNFYPDPEAFNISECEYAIERHGFTRQRLRGLKSRPGFRPNVIEHILANLPPDYVKEHFENALMDGQSESNSSRYEVLEYWGIMDRKIADEFEVPIPNELEDEDQVQVNIWICAGQVLRFILNPFTPSRIPYQVCPYEINPYQFWGVGVPENMEDAQMIMNGHARMAIDNLALAGNVVFEVDETNLVNSEDMRIYPGRVFRRQGGAPGQSIFAIKFPDTSQSNLAMFDKFRQLADESTGIPSYSHGQTGVSGTTRTSSGMSMLMSASALNIKTVVRNIDDYLIRPLGEGMFAWNMQFNTDLAIRGDLEIRARGTSALMLREVRSQRLMMFMQVASNPALAPFVKWQTILRELARDLEIDPEKFTNNMEEAKLQAMLLNAYTQALGPAGGPQSPSPEGGPPGPGGSGSVPGGVGGVSPADTQGSGNGTIGTGTPQMPGTPGFTGNTG